MITEEKILAMGNRVKEIGVALITAGSPDSSNRITPSKDQGRSKILDGLLSEKSLDTWDKVLVEGKKQLQNCIDDIDELLTNQEGQ